MLCFSCFTHHTSRLTRCIHLRDGIIKKQQYDMQQQRQQLHNLQQKLSAVIQERDDLNELVSKSLHISAFLPLAKNA